MSTEQLRPSYTDTRRMSEESREFLSEYGGMSGSVTVSKMAAVCCLILAVLGKMCTGVGIALLIYTKGMEFPLDSGSGIWTGVMVVVSGYLGVLIYWKTGFSGALDLNLFRRKMVRIHYAVLLITLSLSILHVVYTFWGLEVCVNQEGACYKDVLREDVKSLEAVCLCIALFVVCILFFVVILIGNWMKRSASRRREAGTMYDTL